MSFTNDLAVMDEAIKEIEAQSNVKKLNERNPNYGGSWRNRVTHCGRGSTSNKAMSYDRDRNSFIPRKSEDWRKKGTDVRRNDSPSGFRHSKASSSSLELQASTSHKNLSAFPSKFRRGVGNVSKPSYTRFGYKKMEEMVLNHDSDQIIVYILQNEQVFQTFLNEDIRPDLLNLLMKLLVKMLDTQFTDSKLSIFFMVCQKSFVDKLNSYITCFLTDQSYKNIIQGHQFFKNSSILFKELITLIPHKAVESIDTLLSVCVIVLNKLIPQFPDFKESLNIFEKQQEELELVKQRRKETELAPKKAAQIDEEPPNDFRELSIYPSSEDLMERSFLRENIVEGSYRDVYHYLDVQFRLLREDFMEPLRQGINQYKESLISTGKDKMKKNFNIRIYTKVRVIAMSHDSKNFGELSYTVQFDKKFASKIRWEYSKRFLFGSLCLFSHNNFETFQLGTVSNRDVKDLKEGIVHVHFKGDNLIGNQLFTTEYVMAESSAFFEPVLQTLNTMKKLPIDKLPMEDYILVKDIHSEPPKYVASKPHVLIEGREVSVHDFSLWPSSESLGLNSSQCAALKSMISNKFCVIQGPPGTGKTYLGLKFVKFLFDNYSFDSPILMVCYTNHALDQFLEGLLNVTNKIIRIGGQSKNDALNQYNYKNVRKKHVVSTVRLNDLRNEMNISLKQITLYNNLINKIRSSEGIINVLGYKDMKLKGTKIFSNSSEFLEWLLGDDMYEQINYIFQVYEVVGDNEVENSNGQSKKEEADCNSDDEEEIIRSNYMQMFADDDLELTITQDSISYVLSKTKLNLALAKMQAHLFDLNSMEASDEEKRSVILELSSFTAIVESVENRIKQCDVKPSRKFAELFNLNLWTLSDNDRWAMYFYWVRDMINYSSKCISHQQTKYSSALNHWRELKVIEDLQTLQDLKPKILGLTTTGTARHHSLLCALKPSIIIVEEAAEVLEAHIIISLVQSCEHLILIGDHKQLRPNPSTLKLAKDYHLDISLFERMIKNGVGCSTLNVQHRMKPNIAALIVPTIYSELYNHSSVDNFPPVLGIAKNLFFIDHKIFEMKDNNLESHCNPHEAEFMVALCRHLLLQGYEPSDITILTTYSGQQFYLRDLKKQMKSLKEVRMTVVDNYQGEENKIILLSLVRSNEEGKIGFLKTENRICVALSRAKHGLFIIGNMDMLKSNSKIWSEINEKLRKDGAIGDSLSLVCQIHGKVTQVKCAKDFDLVVEGGCSSKCNRMMPCGHFCQSLCHVLDLDHENIKCTQPCSRSICTELDHKCPLECYKTCKPCYIMVRRSLPQCGHDALMKCFEEPSKFKCLVEVEDVLLECKHETKRFCHVPINLVKCQTPCPLRLECGHACALTCHVKSDPEHLEYKCMKPCPRLNALCKKEHQCKKRCYEECGKCVVLVKQTLECGHTHRIECSANSALFKCERDCSKKLPCGHKCLKKCFEPCDPMSCRVKVEKIIPSCGHKVKVDCCVEPVSGLCKKACQRLLSCGHPCKLKCVADCNSYQCLEYVPSPVKPACGHPGQVICSKRNEVTDPTSDKLLRYCREPCRQELPCKDICSGTCGNCMQGRIHQVCVARCGNVLICGHTCKVPCREECPPCKEKCLYKCQHSECGRACGTPCVKCTEPCSWKCKHLACTRQCGDDCDREPCYEPCDQTLPCGHPCVGFCGEPCPPKCRICHEEELTELFLGHEDEEDARFVLLHDCAHIIESQGLESWLHMTPEEGKDEEIGVKGCPKCKMPITSTLRFSNISKRAFKLVHRTKENIFGSQNEISRLKTEIIEVIFPNLKHQIVKADAFVRRNKNLDAILLEDRSFNQMSLQKVGRNQLTLIKFKCTYLIKLLEYFKLVDTNKNLRQPSGILDDLLSKIKDRFNLILYHLSQRKVKISHSEVEQFYVELKRFNRIVEFYQMLCKSPTGCELNSTREKKAKEIIKELFSMKKYDYDEKMLEEMENYSLISDVFYQPVTKKDFEEVQKAMMKDFMSPNKQGHWFTCSKGHIYAITECGGAMATGVCPECKEIIGGSNHTLVRTSRLASQVDGARFAAWSDQQNLQNYQF